MHGQGVLSDERWEAQLRLLKMYLGQPGGAYSWERFRHVHTDAFAQVVEQQQSDLGALPAAQKGAAADWPTAGRSRAW